MRVCVRVCVNCQRLKNKFKAELKNSGAIGQLLHFFFHNAVHFVLEIFKLKLCIFFKDCFPYL